MSLHLRTYILQLSRDVTEAQFNELKYVLVDYVPNGLSDKMKQTHELFHALEQVRKLTPELLQKAFDAVGRWDLSEDVAQNQHLFQVFSKQNDAPHGGTPKGFTSHEGYDDIVCDGGVQANSAQPRKAAVKEGEPLGVPYKPTEKTNVHHEDAQHTDMDVDYHQQTDMDVDKKTSLPAHVGSMPEPQVSAAFPDDVVTDAGGEDAGSATEGAAASINSNPGTSTSEGATSGYEKAGARPKDSNPITKSSNTKDASEQIDHVTTPNQSGSLHSDGSQSEGAAAAPVEKSPTGAAAVADVGVGSGKGPSESDVDFNEESTVHGSVHAHAEVKKSTTTVVTESHSVSYDLGATCGLYAGPPPAAGAAYDGPAHNMGQQQLGHYTRDGFVIRIPQGQHCESADGAGLVIMESGQQFCIEVQNNSDYACEVEITFGGRFLGVWLVENGQNNTTVITGSSWETGILTFYSQTDGNAPSRSGDLQVEDNGIIECVFAPEAVKLFVELSSGRREVVIRRKATVGELIDKITDTCGIRGISCLVYNNKGMCRPHPLAKYNLKFEDTVRVLTDEEDLVIESHERNPITMPVDPHKTCVKEVVDFLLEKLDYPPDMLRLMRKGKRLALDEKLTQAFLDGEPVIKLEIAEPIIVRVRQLSEDKKPVRTPVRTHSFATVTSLKTKMIETGVVMDGAQLLFDGKCLTDDNSMCLTEYGITHGSVIEIRPAPEVRDVHRGFSSGSRSFGSTTRSFDLSGLFSSGSRGFGLGGSRGIDDELDVCSTGMGGRTGVLRDLPGGFLEGKLRLTGGQEVSRNYDYDFDRKFEGKLGVTLKLRLVSSDVRANRFPGLPSSRESGLSSHQSSTQGPARPPGPTRTKVPPPVPE